MNNFDHHDLAANKCQNIVQPYTGGIMRHNALRIIVIAFVLLIQNAIAKDSDNFGEREVKIATHLWGVDISIPVKEFPNGVSNPTRIRWKLIDSNSRILTFNSYDPVSNSNAHYRMLFSKLDVGLRKYALIERINISGYELSPYERSKFAEAFYNENSKLVRKYSSWLDSLKQSEVQSSKVGDWIIETSNKNKDSAPNSQSDLIVVDSELANSSSSIVACDSIDSASFDADYSEQIKDEVLPSYPEQALNSGTRSVVEVLIRLNRQGVVSGVDIISSGGDSFDNAVTQSVYSSRFKPFIKSGCSFQCQIKKKYNFEL